MYLKTKYKVRIDFGERRGYSEILYDDDIVVSPHLLFVPRACELLFAPFLVVKTLLSLSSCVQSVCVCLCATHYCDDVGSWEKTRPKPRRTSARLSTQHDD